eukprot:COSAG06_NODE_23125_length_702_cov_0.442786_3_plen_48_part_01
MTERSGGQRRELHERRRHRRHRMASQRRMFDRGSSRTESSVSCSVLAA